MRCGRAGLMLLPLHRLFHCPRQHQDGDRQSEGKSGKERANVESGSHSGMLRENVTEPKHLTSGFIQRPEPKPVGKRQIQRKPAVPPIAWPAIRHCFRLGDGLKSKVEVSRSRRPAMLIDARRPVLRTIVAVLTALATPHASRGAGCCASGDRCECCPGPDGACECRAAACDGCCPGESALKHPMGGLSDDSAVVATELRVGGCTCFCCSDSNKPSDRTPELRLESGAAASPMIEWLSHWSSHPISDSHRWDDLVPAPSGNVRQALLCVWRN